VYVLVETPPLQRRRKDNNHDFGRNNKMARFNVMEMLAGTPDTMRRRFYKATIFTFVLMGIVSPTWAGQTVSERSISYALEPNTTSRTHNLPEGVDQAEFAVASVRRSTPDAGQKGYDFLNPYSTLELPKGGLFSARSQLLGLIIFAYNIRDASQYPTLAHQLPKWAQSEWFDIEARAEGNADRNQVRLMMQSLLAKRFSLLVHTEVRQGKVFALEVNGRGQNLRPHAEGSPCIDRSDVPTESHQGVPPTVYCGIDVSRLEGRLHLVMVDVSMDEVATVLGGIAGTLGARAPLPVIDRTGLHGKYDATLDFVPDKGESLDATSDIFGPTFTKALVSQLGLRLTTQLGPTTVFDIDHVDEPSQN
jgi:uncharacterized protein (TIGR03435 family)